MKNNPPCPYCDINLCLEKHDEELYIRHLNDHKKPKTADKQFPEKGYSFVGRTPCCKKCCRAKDSDYDVDGETVFDCVDNDCLCHKEKPKTADKDWRERFDKEFDDWHPDGSDDTLLYATRQEIKSFISDIIHDTIQEERADAFQQGRDIGMKADEVLREEGRAEEREAVLEEIREKLEKLPQDFCNDSAYTDKEMADCLAGVIKYQHQKLQDILSPKIISNEK